jgi:hypothetical protein
MAIKVTSSKPQKTTGGSTKAAAQRKAAPKKAASVSVVSHLSNPVYAGGVSARAPQTQASPTMSLPNGTPTVTPIAPPTIDPFLEPTDMAQQAVENGQWDDYIAGLQQQSDTLDQDVGLKVGDIDRGLAQGVESNDWNSAARGIANSSIKDQNKAQMIAQASATKGAETGKQTTFHDYVGGQKHQVDTVYKPAIKTKYDSLAVKNAQKAKDDWDAAHPPEDTPAAPAADGNPAPTATPGDTTYNYSPTGDPIPSISAGGDQRQQEGWQPVVKNGGFYHYYPNGDRWVYIRPATG